MNKKIEVTASTAKWIEIFQDVENLTGKISEALEDYNSTETDKNMDADFSPHLTGLYTSVQKWFAAAAFENLWMKQADGVIKI